MHYILADDGATPIRVSVREWARWFEADREAGEAERRRVGWRTYGDGTVRVSTVFLGLDHDFLGTGPPILWETMIFWPGHDLDMFQRRYRSRVDAERGHKVACRLVERAVTRHWRSDPSADSPSD